MDKKVILSIICPVYNKAAYLKRCIESVVNQTFTDFELILVDDGSQDESLAICRGYESQYDFIKVISIENSGPSHARNVGIDVANGKYIGFVDADDYIAENMFETLVSMADKHDADVSICDIKKVASDGRVLSQNNISIPCGILLIREDILEYILRPSFEGDVVNGLWSVDNKIFKKNLVVNNMIRFDESRIRAEDGCFNKDVMLIAQSVIATDEKLYYYVDYPSDHLMARFQDDQFELWCRDRINNRQKATELGFRFDESKAAGGLINSIVQYIRWEYEVDRSKAFGRMKNIFESEDFREALTYPNIQNEFIKQTKVIVWLARKRLYRGCSMVYGMWNLLRKAK